MAEEPTLYDLIQHPERITNIKTGPLMYYTERMDAHIREEKEWIRKLGISAYREKRETMLVLLVELSIRFRHALLKRKTRITGKSALRIKIFTLDFSAWPHDSQLMRRINLVFNSLNISPEDQLRRFIKVPPIEKMKGRGQGEEPRRKKGRRPPRRPR